MKLTDILIEVSESDRDFLIDNMSKDGLFELILEITETPEGYKKAGATTGAMVGAGLGAAGATGIWAAKRLALQRRLKTCDELSGEEKIKCRNAIEDQIEELAAKAMAGGVAATAVGAGLGGYIGGKRGSNKYTKMVNKEKEAKLAEEKRKKQEEDARRLELEKKQKEEEEKKAAEDVVSQRVAQYRANREKEKREKEERIKAQPSINSASIAKAQFLLDQANRRMGSLYVWSGKKQAGINRMVYNDVTRQIAQAKRELSKVNLELDSVPDATSKLIDSLKKKIEITEDKLKAAIESAKSHELHF